MSTQTVAEPAVEPEQPKADPPVKRAKGRKTAAPKKTPRKKAATKTAAPKDPEAQALAKAAGAIAKAAGRTSAFLPSEAREVLDVLDVDQPRRGTIRVRWDDPDAEPTAQEATFTKAALQAVAKGEGDADVRRELKRISSGASQKLYGGKVACFVLALVQKKGGES
jgi:hypothetical protein